MRSRLLRPAFRRASQLGVPPHALRWLAHVRVVGRALALDGVEAFRHPCPVDVGDLIRLDFSLRCDAGVQDGYSLSQLLVLI